MNDYFAEFGVPRRPWLDPDELQTIFLARSSEVHPDRVHNAAEEERIAANRAFTALNAAYQCLRDPKRRVRHLLELECRAPVDQLERLPSAAADFFFKVGAICRRVDRFLEERRKAGPASPLLKVQQFEAAMEWRDQLEELRSTLAGQQAALEEEWKGMNSAWDSAPGPHDPQRPAALPLGRLEEVYREYSYVVRWLEQVRDRIVPLSF